MNNRALNAATIGKSFDRDLTPNAGTLSDDHEPTDWTTSNLPVLRYLVAFYDTNTDTLLYPLFFRQAESESISLGSGPQVTISDSMTDADYAERYANLDLPYYRQRISDEQLRLLMDMVGVEPAPEGFDATEIWYPEEL